MSASKAVTAPSLNVKNARAFWERLWRSAGIQSIGLFLLGYIIYGTQPHVGASPDALTAFYTGNRGQILLAAVFFGLAILNLLWFAAALKATLTDAGLDGWGAAATASSTAVGILFFLIVAISAALAYSIAGSANNTFVAGINDSMWALFVLSSFPRAMLTMSAAFGLWRAGTISYALFAAGVAAVVLTLLGGTTWLAGGIWAPDGVYSRFVSPGIGVIWGLVVSGVLLTRSPATRSAW